MAVPPCAEGPGEARGRPYGQEPQVQRRERLVAVAQRRERRRRLLHLPPPCTGTGDGRTGPCLLGNRSKGMGIAVLMRRGPTDAGTQDHGTVAVAMHIKRLDSGSYFITKSRD